MAASGALNGNGVATRTVVTIFATVSSDANPVRCNTTHALISLQLRRILTCVVGEDRTHGFFVAVFERPSCAVGEAQTALPPPMRCPAACDEARQSKKKKKKKKKKKEKVEGSGSKETAAAVTSNKRSLEEAETNAPEAEAEAVGVDLASVRADRGDGDGATGSTRTQRKNRARRQQKKRQKMQATAVMQDATDPLS